MKQKDIIFILASSVLVVVAWIVFNVLHQSFTSTISTSLGIAIAPIARTFDTATIATLKKRLQVTPAYDVEEAPTPTPTPVAPSLAPLSPISSQSAKTASTGGSTK